MYVLTRAARAVTGAGADALSAYKTLRGNEGAAVVSAARLCARSLALCEWQEAQCARAEAALDATDPRVAASRAGVAPDDLSQAAASAAATAAMESAAAAASALHAAGETWHSGAGGVLIAEALGVLSAELALDDEVATSAEANLFAGGAHGQAMRVAEALRSLAPQA